MVEIKPGLELDKAVADAIGLKWHDREMEPFVGVLPQAVKREAGYWFSDGTWYERIPAFSTDLNAAFAAAEKAGLLVSDGPNGHCLYSSTTHRDEGDNRVRTWFVGCVDELDSLDGHISEGPTPALAICAAILKLKA